LCQELHRISRQHPRFGYRRAWNLLRGEGWNINRKKVQRLWRIEGLKVPRIPRKKRALGHSQNSCLLRRATRKNEVWTVDFLHDSCADGSRLKILPVLDEYTRECLVLEVGRSMTSKDVKETLRRLFDKHGCPAYLRSDNGPEFIGRSIRNALEELGVQTLFIQPGSPWENGVVESFNARLRDEVLARESFWNLLEARVVLEEHRQFYNTKRPHRSLGGLSPEAFARGTPTDTSRLGVVKAKLTA
jgi:transposase InsO family protein